MGTRYVKHWPAWSLAAVGLLGVGLGIVIGILGAVLVLGPGFLFLVAVQALGALGYPLAPLFRGLLHRDSVFALTWGSLPFLTSYYAQSGQVISYISIPLVILFAGIALVEIRVSRTSRELRKQAREASVARSPGSAFAAPPYRRADRFLQGLSISTVLAALVLLTLRTWMGG